MEHFGPVRADIPAQHVSVWGRVADAAQVPRGVRQVELSFQLSRPGASTAGLMQTTAPVTVTPDVNGDFMVRLVPNDLIKGNTHYRVVATWLDSAGQLGRSDGYDIFVPISGGEVSVLIGGRLLPAQVYWQATRPVPWPTGAVWVNTITGDVLRKR